MQSDLVLVPFWCVKEEGTRGRSSREGEDKSNSRASLMKNHSCTKWKKRKRETRYVTGAPYSFPFRSFVLIFNFILSNIVS